MRLVDADVILERVQDYFNAVKAVPMEPTTREYIETINQAVVTLIEITPTKFYTTRGY